jgi:hypothetical protein
LGLVRFAQRMFQVQVQTPKKKNFDYFWIKIIKNNPNNPEKNQKKKKIMFYCFFV